MVRFVEGALNSWGQSEEDWQLVLDDLVSNRGIWGDVNNMQTQASSGKSNNKRIFKISFHCHAEGKVAKRIRISHLSNYTGCPKMCMYNFNLLFKKKCERQYLYGNYTKGKSPESYKITLNCIKISRYPYSVKKKTIITWRKNSRIMTNYSSLLRFPYPLNVR